MKESDKLKRKVAFYLSAVIFFVTLPVILSYALGYKIDYAAFQVYKTGIMYLTSQPAGASIYINGKLHKDLTPAQIEELKPGRYGIKIKRDGFYPWERELVVKPNMVTKAERIILFPIARKIKDIGDIAVLYFAVSDRNQIYYMTKNGLFSSNMDGTVIKKLSSYSDWPQKILGVKFSADGRMLLCYDEDRVIMVRMVTDEEATLKDRLVIVEEIFEREEPIIDVFWYPEPGYIIVVSRKTISAVELRGGKARSIVILYAFKTTPKNVYYDEGAGAIYFTDIKEASEIGGGSYIYRLDLKQTFFDAIKSMLARKEENSINGKR